MSQHTEEDNSAEEAKTEVENAAANVSRWKGSARRQCVASQ